MKVKMEINNNEMTFDSSLYDDDETGIEYDEKTEYEETEVTNNFDSENGDNSECEQTGIINKVFELENGVTPECNETGESNKVSEPANDEKPQCLETETANIVFDPEDDGKPQCLETGITNKVFDLENGIKPEFEETVINNFDPENDKKLEYVETGVTNKAFDPEGVEKLKHEETTNIVFDPEDGVKLECLETGITNKVFDLENGIKPEYEETGIINNFEPENDEKLEYVEPGIINKAFEPEYKEESEYDEPGIINTAFEPEYKEESEYDEPGIINTAFEPEYKEESEYEEQSRRSSATDSTFTTDTTKKERDCHYDFDVVLEEIGSMGKYQLLLIFLVYSITIPAGVLHNASIFLAARPDFRCSLAPLDNNSLYNLTEEQLREFLLPMNHYTNSYDQCRRFNYNLTSCKPPSLDCITPNVSQEKVATIPCDMGYWYDTSVYTSTVVTEWNMVCEDTLIGATVTSAFFIGVLFSSLISDSVVFRFGRLPVMLVSGLGISAIGIGSSYTWSPIVFAFMRFFIGTFLQLGYYSCTVYVFDITGHKWRDCIGGFVQLVFARTLIGYLCLSGFAYALRDWHQLQFIISFVPIPFIIFWFFLPESPRWLFEQGHNEKAIEICCKMVRRNGKTFSEDLWTRAQISNDEDDEETADDKTKYGFIPCELFVKPKMRLITINVMFCWFVNSLVYFGLSMNASALSGSDFLNNALNALVEVPAYLMVVCTKRKFHRKSVLCFCLIGAGFSCIASTLVGVLVSEASFKEDVITALTLTGKMAISGSFAIVYTFTAEIYPVDVRGRAVGLGVTAGRVGSIVAPFVIYIQYGIPWITTVIFGTLALTAGLLSVTFPNASGKKMPESTQDAEAFYRGEAELGHQDPDGSISAQFYATRL